MTESDNLTTADIARGSSAQAPEEDASGEPESRAEDSGLEPLLPAEESEGFRSRWVEIQTRFVDAPREAVEQGDALVAEVMQRIAQTFASEREALESQWSGGSDPSTEDLRVGLQRYRSFFERLLST